MSIDLTIPAFLRAAPGDRAAARAKADRILGRRQWRMPHPSTAAVVKAVARGHDTHGQLMKCRSVKGLTGTQLSALLRQLVDSGALTIEGKRYSRG